MASSHTHTMGQVPAALRLLAAVACAAGAAAAWGGGQAPSPEARPDPVRWPGVFSSQTLTNRSNHFSLDKLWYDWNFKTGVGRQVIRIVGEDGSLVYDIMPGDGEAAPSRLGAVGLPVG